MRTDVRNLARWWAEGLVAALRWLVVALLALLLVFGPAVAAGVLAWRKGAGLVASSAAAFVVLGVTMVFLTHPGR